MPKVSIIIPVYNAGKYLEYCIDSLLKQTLYDCEFIFVNDGSTDDSLQVLEKYRKQDSRIVIINQHNQGISCARNTGLISAKGDYIGFSDNDDYMEPDMLEQLYSKAIQYDTDIVVSSTILGRDGKRIFCKPVFPVNEVYNTEFIRENIIPNLLEKEDLFGVWNKIYSRSLIVKHQIHFPPNREIEEDQMFNLMAFNKADSAIFIDYNGYNFREMVVSESRRFIERDFFALSEERYRFNYKAHFGLQISDELHERLKAIRHINRVFYLTFISITNKKYAFNDRFNYVWYMISSQQTQMLTGKYKDYIAPNAGKFEKIIMFIINHKAKKTLYMLMKVVSMIYTPKLSELLRYFNGREK